MNPVLMHITLNYGLALCVNQDILLFAEKHREEPSGVRLIYTRITFLTMASWVLTHSAVCPLSGVRLPLNM